MKAGIRKEMLGRLRALDRRKKEEYDRFLAQALQEHPVYQEAKTLACFLSMEIEVATQPIVEAALRAGKRVLVPKTFLRGKMCFMDYSKVRLEKSSFGVLEPVSGQEVPAGEIDLIYVPGLAWNEQGYRIGYGGGYYDRYLQNFSGATISLLYPFQAVAFDPESFDQPVQHKLVAELVEK